MNTNTHEVDVIVAGGGLAGLAAAAYLARDGRRVELFERSAGLGGRGSTQNHDGFLYNKGAHAVYEKTPAAAVLRELGVKFTYGSPANVKLLYGGQTYPLPDTARTLFGSRMLDFGAKIEASKLLMSLMKMDAGTVASVSLGRWLDDNVRHPAVRAFVEASVRVAVYTDAPYTLSMQVAVEQLQNVLGGKIYYVDGGWQVLVDGIAEMAREAGAVLHTGNRVERVSRAGGAWEVELGDGTVRRAASVVLAMSPTEASKIADGEAGETLGAWARQAVKVHAATLDVALRRLPQPDTAVTISMDGPHFLTTHSHFAKLAPEGKALVYSIKYLAPGVPSDPKVDERELEAMFDIAQPGWRDEVIERRFLPNQIVYNWLATAEAGGLAARPGPAVPGAPGLFVAGDWVGPRGSLASASLWSARTAAQAIVAERREAAQAVAA
ncbi:MAG TPA: FAD-dependent oxidoreductase [Chloroflexia bacterium]|nr:FAD-dependent oxidoreductase [Chloroflexia bacterium]